MLERVLPSASRPCSFKHLTLHPHYFDPSSDSKCQQTLITRNWTHLSFSAARDMPGKAAVGALAKYTHLTRTSSPKVTSRKKLEVTRQRSVYFYAKTRIRSVR